MFWSSSILSIFTYYGDLINSLSIEKKLIEYVHFYGSFDKKYRYGVPETRVYIKAKDRKRVCI